ncbi:MAG: Mg2+ and Co2+ transporter [Gammaproteobacteria bacterium]|nr:Mg2+ and Co2+ transporter [Gammaproteobacteria bacterium]
MSPSSNRKSPEPLSWFERLSRVLFPKPRNRKQLIETLRAAKKRQLFDSQALGMIEGVLQISDMQVRDIMVPRTQMITVEQNQDPETFLPLVIESGHSRFPVIADSKDEVIGILLAKELLKYVFHHAGKTQFNIVDSLRPCIYVPESKRLDSLLKEFRLNHNHMAIVLDEYGGVAGLVTIEDILEQIVGEIEDEYDLEEHTEQPIVKISDTIFSIAANMPIEEFNTYFETTLEDEDFDTIGGLILQKLGHVPKPGEKIRLGQLDFEVKKSDGRRIHYLQLEYNKSLSELVDE